MKNRMTLTAIERIRRREPIRWRDCLVWPGALTNGSKGGDGYGYVFNPPGSPKTRITVHRAVWEDAHGPIPDGIVIDHECHNQALRRGADCGPDTCLHRRCYNLAHLRAVTNAQNRHAALDARLAGSPIMRPADPIMIRGALASLSGGADDCGFLDIGGW